MSVNRPNVDIIQKCAANVRKIRNVCILAHVDHGKTTIADSLLATNGLLSKRSAGQIRYLDDRRDEQERGITMKSSAVSLYYSLAEAQEHDLILNLIDTPGHIDFSTEVAAAVRICDGALIIVDVVEGVCVQTRDAIKQSYDEHVNMILIINKIDRLIVELHKSVEEIFPIVLRIIEDCNATIAELCRYDIENEEQEEKFLFSPPKGNVVFASALDGWGVTTKLISSVFVDILVGESIETLNDKMWNFDYYVEPSTKKVLLGALEKKKENLFIQLCLKTIHHVYFTFIIRMERGKLESVLSKLKIKNSTREMHHNDPRVQVKAILQAWSPLSTTIMLQCYNIIPSPCDVSERRIEYLVRGNRFYENKDLKDCEGRMIDSFRNCSSSDVSTVVYISKMFSVHKKNLSQNKPKIFIPTARVRKTPSAEDQKCVSKQNVEPEQEKDEKPNDVMVYDDAIIALGRVFSGTLKRGQEVYFLSSSYKPSATQTEEENSFLQKSNSAQKVVISDLYMLLGHELILVDSVPTGCICGIGNLEAVVVRTGTLSSTLDCLPLIDGSYMEPIVRNTIEPVDPKCLPKLRHGLKLLMQSDSCLQVVMQETGEHVLVTAGDVHLAKCLEDLRTKFIDFEVVVSKPMVSLRESIISLTKNIDIRKDCPSCVETSGNDFGFYLKLIAVPLPTEMVKFITTNFQLLRAIEDHQQEVDKSSTSHTEKIFQTQHTRNLIQKLREQMKTVFKNCGGFWPGMWQNIWSVGKTRNCINLMFNNTSDYKGSIFTVVNQNDLRLHLDHSITNGFDMCCRAGPICEEPLVNCAFIVLDYRLENYSALQLTESKVQFVANIPVAVKAAFREAFEKQPQRLVEPIFTTDIQVNINILGKVYSVISKRHGKVLDAVGMDQKEKVFLVKAQIPVIESDGFANEIRKTTSGQANPNLRFSHYEVVDGDPYYEPESDDEDDDSVNIESAIRANKLMKEVRRRKGLLVDDQIVVHAEKQRTLNKKK